MSVTMIDPATKVALQVPDALVERYKDAGYKASGAAYDGGSDGHPGVPDDTWGFADLKVYALELGIDIGKEKSKKGLLALIEGFGAQVDESTETEGTEEEISEDETDTAGGSDGTSRDW
jgi:hypothetical protein